HSTAPSLPTSSSLHTAPPTTEIYTLSLHDALPILADDRCTQPVKLSAHFDGHRAAQRVSAGLVGKTENSDRLRSEIRHQLANDRSEEHTSELQSPCNLVCRLLLEKKKAKHTTNAAT